MIKNILTTLLATAFVFTINTSETATVDNAKAINATQSDNLKTWHGPRRPGTRW